MPNGDTSEQQYMARNPVRFVTATSLFDGHDAAINLIRRMLQFSGMEVVHLGHNRSVREIVDAAIEEDVQAIAVSSYQGGHIEFFEYMIDLLRERRASHIKVYGGGGGVIVPAEIAQLEAYGVEKIFSPEDGRQLGLQGMIDAMIERADFGTLEVGPPDPDALQRGEHQAIARAITSVELQAPLPEMTRTKPNRAVVVGLTGTGGAGKSSVTDELLLRFLHDFPDLRIGVLCVDPSRRRTGGALLGDRIRLNSLASERVYMRSLATRRSGSELSAAVPRAIEVLQTANVDVLFVETSGIGQGDTEITDIADISIYVMTAEYGAASQLEKIDMLDFADIVVLNKFEKPGSKDALRAVRKQWRRNRAVFEQDADDEDLPIYGTVASRFNDLGVTALYLGVLKGIAGHWQQPSPSSYEEPTSKVSPSSSAVIAPERQRYLAEIAAACRGFRSQVEKEAEIASKAYALDVLARAADETDPETGRTRAEQRDDVLAELSDHSRALVTRWDDLVAAYSRDELVYSIRGKERRATLFSTTLAGTKVPRVALPRLSDWGDRLRWRSLEGVPGEFPFTAGVFPFKRKGEEPKRQFAGEGTPARTNARFHYLCRGEEAKRLSTAFDSVTLYGDDPDPRPDIYGKVGESGVSVCTLDDVKILYGGFDLCDPSTSVSKTINGPAPIMLAMFLNAAIDQQIDRFTTEQGRAPKADELEALRSKTLSVIRGTVQADILKEDQAQNTCIFNTGFALKMMGDIQQYFIEHSVRNYYSVSVSGYHIAEAGANPISQLAFTLANGFTYVEYYLARGMAIDDFAANLSFFFSNGLDAEYAVMGRVARRIWSVAMRERYGANSRGQKLKYHIQTSGRSLHAQEVNFNDIRTTLQALLAIYDNCNSLHTNAYDEAVTTPTEESVRRAMAIQLIINREFGMSLNENPNQGAFVLDELTDLVEEAVLSEFEELSLRGGVLGAMEREYQRGKIQDESLLYERMKHSGELPIVGVNTFLPESGQDFDAQVGAMALTRAGADEKQHQLESLQAFQERHADQTADALAELQKVAVSGGNIFAELMSTVRVASLGQISDALYRVGGRYRRNM